jgi:hypothetical protein
MPPELFLNDHYDCKVDVYSYGMVLWEMLTGHTPFSGKTEVQVQQLVVLENRRPQMPADAPAGLKALIYACWEADPRKRPTFAEIVQRFASHVARFRGCDDGAVERIFANEDTANDLQKDVDLPEDLRAEDDGFQDAEESMEWPMLAMMASARDGRRMASMVSVENADRFFEALRPLLVPEAAIPLTAAVAACLAVLFEKDGHFLARFIGHGLHELILVNPETMCGDLGIVLLHLFSYHPNNVTPAIIASVGSIANVAATDVLTLLNLYVTADPKPAHLALAYRALFDHGEDLARNGLGSQFITNLQTYFEKDEGLAAGHKKATISLFRKVLKSGDSAATSAILKAVAAIPSLASLLKKADMGGLLMDSTFCSAAIDLCARYPSSLKYDSAIVKALLCNAQRSEDASRVLIAACAAEKVAVFTAELGPLWIAARLPRLVDTVRLVRAVLAFPSSSEKILSLSQLQQLLRDISVSGDPTLVAEVATIVKSLPHSPEFIGACSSSNFLEQYYRVVVDQKDPVVLAGAIGVTELLARAAFLEQFLIILPLLKHLLGNKSWRGLAVSLLATLSVHERARGSLVKNGFPQVVGPLAADPRLAPYVTCFLSYVPANQP